MSMIYTQSLANIDDPRFLTELPTAGSDVVEFFPAEDCPTWFQAKYENGKVISITMYPEKVFVYLAEQAPTPAQ